MLLWVIHSEEWSLRGFFMTEILFVVVFPLVLMWMLRSSAPKTVGARAKRSDDIRSSDYLFVGSTEPETIVIDDSWNYYYDEVTTESQLGTPKNLDNF